MLPDCAVLAVAIIGVPSVGVRLIKKHSARLFTVL